MTHSTGPRGRPIAMRAIAPLITRSRDRAQCTGGERQPNNTMKISLKRTRIWKFRSSLQYIMLSSLLNLIKRNEANGCSSQQVPTEENVAYGQAMLPQISTKENVAYGHTAHESSYPIAHRTRSKLKSPSSEQ